jgi:uncharacterized protein (DUF885 family)
MKGRAEFFESYYRLRPVNATFTGVHDHDHRLPDWSPEGLAAAVEEMRELEAGRQSCATSVSLVAQDATEGAQDFSPADRDLASTFLDIQIAEHESLHFQRGNPSLAIGEVAFGVISLMTRPFAPVDPRASAAAARLAAASGFLAGACRSMAEGVPDIWRAKALRECDGVERLLRGGIARWIQEESVASAAAADLARAAESAGAALDTFRAWLQQAPSASEDRLACGSDFFDMLLARGHWCDRTRRDLASEAKTALEDALARLDAQARAVTSGGWPEIQRRLTADVPAPDAYLPAYERTWEACRHLSDRRQLVTWPDFPIRYVHLPAPLRDAAPFLYYLHYRSPAPFDRLAVHDYVVPATATASAIKLNHVVHHGAIGHHVQNFYAYRGASEIGRVAAVDCASRIGMFCGGTMAEGWACYATDLMDEFGFLTADESVSQQHTRARLLARAVVDIGLHERSLTCDEAVAVYRDRIGMSPEAAQAEACKNSMFPGAAIMYWLGTDGIHQLRRARARIDGAAFSLRAFHDRLLSFGAIPVPLIARVWT